MSGGTPVSKMPVWVGLILYSGLKMEVGRRRGGWLVLVRMCVFGFGRLHSTCNACVGSGYVQDLFCILSELRGTSDEQRSKSMYEFRHSGAESFLSSPPHVKLFSALIALQIESLSFLSSYA